MDTFTRESHRQQFRATQGWFIPPRQIHHHKDHPSNLARNHQMKPPFTWDFSLTGIVVQMQNPTGQPTQEYRCHHTHHHQLEHPAHRQHLQRADRPVIHKLHHQTVHQGKLHNLVEHKHHPCIHLANSRNSSNSSGKGSGMRYSLKMWVKEEKDTRTKRRYLNQVELPTLHQELNGIVPRLDFISRNLGTGQPTIQCTACEENTHWSRSCPYDNFRIT